MGAEARPVIHGEARISAEFLAEFSFDGCNLTVEWTPRAPDRGSFGSPGSGRKRWKYFWRYYTAARLKFMQRVADEIGAPVLIADTDGTMTTVRPNTNNEEK